MRSGFGAESRAAGGSSDGDAPKRAPPAILSGSMCGNIGMLLLKEDNAAVVLTLLQKMFDVTMARGAHSGGLVTYRKEPSGDQRGSRTRVVNGKRTQLGELLLARFLRNIERQRRFGSASAISAPQLFQGHTRFATSSLTTLGGCHPHQWTPASRQTVWACDPISGTFTCSTRTVEGFITHNGDLDFFELQPGRPIPTEDLQLVLPHVLGAKMPDVVDSACLAGLLDLHRTRGLWQASVRYGYVFGGLRDARDGMAALLKSGALLSARSLDKIADALAHEWTLLLKEDAEAAAAAEAAPIAGALVPSGAAAAAPNDAARMKNHSGSRTASLQGADVEDGFGATGDAAAGMAGWRARAIASRMHERAAALLGSRAAELGLTLPPSCRTATMASETVSAFFEGGLERAAKLILRRASGSFGLTFSHSLDAGGAVPASGTGCSTTGGEVVVCAKGQPMSIAFYPSLGIVLFGSEAAATKAAMRLDPDNNPWWSPERNAAHRAAAHAQQTRLPSSASQPFARNSSAGHPGDGAPFRYDLDDHGGEVVLLRWRERPVQRSVMDPAAAPPQRDDPLQRVPLLSPPPLALLPTRRTELQKYEDGEELAFAYFSEGRSGELTFSSTALSTHAAAAAKPSGPTHVPVGLVKSGGASRASAAAATLRRRSIPLLDNPMVLPLPPTVDDPVGLDLQQLPPTLASLRESFGELGAGAREVGGLPRPALTNQRVARELAAALLDRLAHRGDAAAAGGAVDLDGAKKDSVDLLVAGCEVSLWVGEQFVSDLRTALPALRARAVSSNKLLALFGQNVPIPQLGHPIDEGLQIDGAVVLLLSHSGGTFATLACAKMLRAHTKHVFAVASEVDTHLGRVVNDTAAAEAAVGAAPAAKPAAMVPASMISAPAAPGLGPNQAADAGKTDGPAPPRRSATRVRDASASDDSGAGGTGPRAPSVSRCFSTLTGFRVAEPCSISVAATHQLLTHVLLSLMRSLGGSRPDLFPRARPVAAELATLCGASHLEALREIVGDGEQADTPTGARLRREGRRWADHVLEGPLSWILSAIYILVTVVVGFTPLSAALAAARPLFPSAAGAAGTAEPASFVALGYVVGVLDTAIYAFLPWWTTVLLRLAQRRPWLHRVSGRSVLIADIPWVGQCAEAYLSKLFALSYSVAGLTVYSANPHDHLVHRHTHRVVRGALLAVGRPDGRVHALAAAEATSLLSIKQASSIQSLGVTCETLTLGHNPWPLPRAIPVVLPTIRPQFLSEKLLGLYLAERPVPDASEPGNATGSAAKKNAADRAAGRWLSRLSPADEPGAPPRPMPAKSPNALGGLYAHLASLARLPPAVLRILLAATHECGYVPAERLNEQVVGARLSPIDRGRQARFDALLPAQLLAEQRTLEVLYETRCASLQRLVGFFVLFHAMGRRVEGFWSYVSFGVLAYDMSRTQSMMRVATTASPVSGMDI